jgi:hypothetical protein
MGHLRHLAVEQIPVFRGLKLGRLHTRWSQVKAILRLAPGGSIWQIGQITPEMRSAAVPTREDYIAGYGLLDQLCRPAQYSEM